MAISNHPIEQEELMAYLDGELPVDRAAEVAAHLERCGECRRLADDLRTVSRRLTAWEIPPSSARLAAPGVEAKARGKRRWWPWVAASVAAGLLVVGFLFPGPSYLRRGITIVLDGQPRPDMPGPVSAETAPPKVPQGLDRLERFGALAAPSLAANGPLIVRTASLTLNTTEFDKTRAGLDDILKRHHGYIANMSVSTPDNGTRTLNASLRLPADQLDSAMAEMKKIGRVAEESQGGEEVTQQYVDLEARLSNAQNTEKRLTDLLRDRTGKLSDVLAVEVEIGRVRGQIEQMEAERKSLANRITYATLNAVIAEEYKAQLHVMPDSTAARLRNAAVEGYRRMAGGVVDAVLFVVSFGPAILLWAAILFFPARFLWKRYSPRPR